MKHVGAWLIILGVLAVLGLIWIGTSNAQSPWPTVPPHGTTTSTSMTTLPKHPSTTTTISPEYVTTTTLKG